jgi:hypothetical protein
MTDLAPERPSNDDAAGAEAPEAARNGSTLQASAVPRARIAAVLEWFWLHRAIGKARAAVLAPSERTRELERRARLAADLGRRVLEPGDRVAASEAGAVACELHRQSIFWTLSVEVEATLPRATSGSDCFSEIWRSVRREELRRTAGDEESLAMLEEALLGRDFAYYAELPNEQQETVGKALRGFAEGRLQALDAPRIAVEKIELQRMMRVGLLVLTAIMIVVWPAVAFYRWREDRDLARGKPWRASSIGYGGCESPKQECPEGPEFFFHTGEESNPWLEIDLGKSLEFSGTEVVNRKDCCEERAVPLIVEASDNHAAFRELSRREDAFETWRAHFAPVHARWLRIRAPRTTYLHLRAVRVLP